MGQKKIILFSLWMKNIIFHTPLTGIIYYFKWKLTLVSMNIWKRQDSLKVIGYTKCKPYAACSHDTTFDLQNSGFPCWGLEWLSLVRVHSFVLYIRDPLWGVPVAGC